MTDETRQALKTMADSTQDLAKSITLLNDLVRALTVRVAELERRVGRETIKERR